MATILKFPATEQSPARPRPMKDLSFMCQDEETGDIDYWRVDPTGDNVADYRRGRTLAVEYLEYIGANPTDFNGTLLSLIVRDMIDHQSSRVIAAGFMGTVNEYAMASARLLAGEFGSPNT